MMTEFEAGVRELVARLRDFERRLKKTEDDAGAVEQFVKLITPGLGFAAAGPPPPPPANTVVSGTLVGCGSLGTGGTVEIFDTATMTSLGTATATTVGVYTLNIYLASNTGCTITGTPTSARLTAASITSTIISGATNSGRVIPCGIASGYHCLGPCAIPVADTLHLTGCTVGDEGGCCSFTYPNDTLTYTTTMTAPWTGAGTVGWFGAASFPHGGFTAKYILMADGSLRIVESGLGGSLFLIINPANCPPSPTWSQTCAQAVAAGLTTRFKGSVTE